MLMVRHGKFKIMSKCKLSVRQSKFKIIGINNISKEGRVAY